MTAAKKAGPSRLWRNFRMVAAANVLSQALLLLAAPVLSRLYTPEDFGILALYTTVVSVIAAVATLRFDWLVPNTPTNRGAVGLWLAGAGTLTFVLIIVTIIISLPITETLFRGEYEAIYRYRYMIPAGIAGMALQQLFHGWYIRRSDLAPVSKTKMLQSLGNVASSIALGFAGMGAFGLLAGMLLGSWLGISVLVRNARDLLTELRLLTVHQFSAVVIRWRNKAAVSALVSGINTFSTQAMILFLSVVYGATELGLLAFTYRLIGTPIGVVVQALSQSFWAHAADLARQKDYARLQYEYLRITAILSGLAAVIVVSALIASRFMVSIFGAEWDGMGTILVMLTPMIVGMVVVSPTNHLVALNRQGLQLYADVLRLWLIGLAVLIAGYAEWDFPMAVLAISAGSLAGHAVLCGVQIGLHRKLARARNVPER